MNEIQQVEMSENDSRKRAPEAVNSDDNIETDIDVEKTGSISEWTTRKSNLNRPKRKCRTRKEIPNLNYELMDAYNIIQYLMSPAIKYTNLPFMEERFFDGAASKRNSISLNKVKKLLLEGHYNNITEVIRDIRLIFENCYRAYDSSHKLSKRALKLEMLLEQKLALLTRKIKDKTSIEMTSMPLIRESGVNMDKRPPNSISSDMSQILFYVNKIKARKQKRQLQKKMAGRKSEYVGVLDWENQLIQEHSVIMKAMWELPQIGHFLFLAQKTLNIPELHMYALERVFLMPRESVYLATIITSLLSSPYQRTKLNRTPPMPYRIWHERLKLRVQTWYKLFYAKQRNTRKVFDIVGIEPDFFRVLGDANPLLKKDFHELTYHQRVWLVKALCDYCLHSHKTIQDAISENSWLDQKELILGVDRNKKYYVHFPQFCGLDLRIYRQSICKSFQTPNFIFHKKSSQRKKTKETEIASNIGKKENISKRCKWNDVQPDIDKFELIVDGIDSLEKLISEFSEIKENENIKKKAKQEKPLCEIQLYETLCNLLKELKPWESKLQKVIKRSRLHLKKEWDDYKSKEMKGEEEEVLHNIWDNEPDEEQSNIILDDDNEGTIDYDYSPSNSDSSEEDIDDASMEGTKRKRYINNEEDEEEIDYSSEFEVSVSSRGRIRKIRKKNMYSKEYHSKPNKNKVSNSSDMVYNLDNDSKKSYIFNTSNQAKGQYEWETLRQIIVSSNKPDHPEKIIHKQSENKSLNNLSKSSSNGEEIIIHDDNSKTKQNKLKDEIEFCSSVRKEINTGKTKSEEIAKIIKSADFSLKLKNEIPFDSTIQLESKLDSSELESNIPLKSDDHNTEMSANNETWKNKKISINNNSNKIKDLESKQEESKNMIEKQLFENPKISEGENSHHLQFYNFKLADPAKSFISKNNNILLEKPQYVQSNSTSQLLSIVDQKGNKIFVQCISLMQNSETKTKNSDKNENKIILSPLKNNSAASHLLIKKKDISLVNSVNSSVNCIQNINLTSNNVNTINTDDNNVYFKSVQNDQDKCTEDIQMKTTSTEISVNASSTLNHSSPLISVSPAVGPIASSTNCFSIPLSERTNRILSANTKFDPKTIISSTSDHQNSQTGLTQTTTKIIPSKFDLQSNNVSSLSSSKTTNSLVLNKPSVVNIAKQKDIDKNIRTIPNILIKQTSLKKQTNLVQVMSMSNSQNQVLGSIINGSSNKTSKPSPSIQDIKTVQSQRPLLLMKSNDKLIQMNEIKSNDDQKSNIKNSLIYLQKLSPMTVISGLAIENSDASTQNAKSIMEQKKNIPVNHVHT